MTWFQFPSQTAALIVAIAAGAIGTIPTHAVADGCSEANAWVAQNANSLPKTYDEFVQQPTMHRKAIYSASSPETKAALWRDHLNRYLQEHPELNSDQTEFILETIAELTPELFRNTTNPAVSPQIAAIRTRSEELFSKEEAGLLIAQLGPIQDAATLAVKCSCSTKSDYCGSGHKCYLANCDQVNGCGDLWMFKCDGVCYSP